MPRRLGLFIGLFFLVTTAFAQSLDVTFRYLVPPGQTVTQAYVRGTFNGWSLDDPMTFDFSRGQWTLTKTLTVGTREEYKIYIERNASGSDFAWLTDPLNPLSNAQDNNNSILNVADPMLFQLGREVDGSGNIFAVSAGLFSNEAFTSITYEINGTARDGVSAYDESTGIFRALLSGTVPGGSQFKLTATDAGGDTVTDEVGVIPADVVDAPRPDGTEDGINYDASDATTVTLSLFAPGKNFVHVIGDFNDWTISPDYQLFRDEANPDSAHWWITLDGLTPGQEYAFQYVVDGQIRVADPYSPLILDEGNDPFLGDVFPDLKPYPEGQTTHPVGVFETGQTPFAWSDFTPPPQDELIVYELLLRDFLADHSYETLADTLGYLAGLGVNAIELMPVAEFDGNLSWGYNPAFHLALDKYYGTPDAFKRFVDAAHQRGIAVIVDVVYNHATGQSPLIRLYNNSATGEPGAGPTSDNPYANVSATHPFNVFNDLNHESTATQYWLDRANAFWLEEYNIDGFRFDLSKGFTQKNSGGDVGAWSSYDASRVALLKRMADAIWAARSDAYVILEHFADNREENELATYGLSEGKPGMMLWGNMNHAFNEATMGYNSGSNSNFAGNYYANRSIDVPNIVTYMESHDEQWLMFKNISFGACENFPSGGNGCNTNGGDYNVRDLPIALDRMKMAGAFFLLTPGPKMIWQFGELGYGYGDSGEECLRPGDDPGDCPSFAAGRTGEKPIRWDYRTDPLRYKLYKSWAALLKLRAEHEVFRQATTVTQNLNGGLKRLALSHSSMNAVILGNFNVTPGSLSANFPHPGTWYDYFTGEAIDVTDTGMTFDLAPGQFHVFVSQPVDFPEDGLITVDAAPEADLPTDFTLAQNYPNPFNPSTTIQYALPASSPVRLAVYDVLGREVAVLVDATQASGIQTATFDARHLPSGLYLYRLESGTQVQQRTMMLVK